MPDPEEPIEAVSQRLDNFCTVQRHAAEALGPLAIEFTEVAAGTLAGGKRLRARFCLEGWRAVAEHASGVADLSPAVVDVAAALETFHAAALVHDDLIDNSDTRRGRPATHRAVEAWHRASAWTGDAAAFGRAGAVLAGDLLVAWSDDLFEEGLVHAPAEHAAAARAEYALMRREVTLGQFLDVAEEHAFATVPVGEHAARALRVASYKSARYSVQQPLVIGAALAGASLAQSEALRAFGHPLGMAFQLRDDILGVFGDPLVTGKPAGDDLREGKRTILVAYARESLSDADRAALDGALGDPTLAGAALDRAQAAVRASGALERCEALIADYVVAAESALEGAQLDAGALERLRGLIAVATDRAA